MTKKQNPIQDIRIGNYYVRVSAAKRPGSWGRYSNIGLMKCEPGYTPKSIRDTSRGSVVEYWGPLNSGNTDRCAAARAWYAAVEAAYLLACEELDDYADGLERAYGPKGWA